MARDGRCDEPIACVRESHFVAAALCRTSLGGPGFFPGKLERAVIGSRVGGACGAERRRWEGLFVAFGWQDGWMCASQKGCDNGKGNFFFFLKSKLTH